MKNISLIVLLASILAASVFGQDLSMIRSRLALETYAVEQAAYVSASISASLPLGPDSSRSVAVATPTVRAIEDTIRGIELEIEVANPRDPLFISAAVYDANWRILFWGYRQFYLVKVDGRWDLPEGYGDVVLELSSTIPIPIGPADTALIALLDHNGKSSAVHTLAVSESILYFPRQLAGANSVLGVGAGGEWLYWDVLEGALIDSMGMELGIASMFERIVQVKDSDVFFIVDTMDGIGVNQAAEVTLTSNRTVYATVRTSEGALFKGILVRKSGSSFWERIDLRPAESLVRVPFVGTPGVYYVIPIWNQEDLSEPREAWFPPSWEGKG